MVSNFDKTFNFFDYNLFNINVLLPKEVIKALHYDLNIFLTLKLNFSDNLKLYFYPTHTDLSFKQSLLMVNFILQYGWIEFIILLENYKFKII